MLHLRLVVPPELTDSVLKIMDEHTGTASCTILRGAGPEQPADVVEVDVAREAADDLLERLCDIGLPENGSITVVSVDLTISAAADRAEREAPGSGVDAVVWDEVASRTGEDSELTGVFLTLLIIATLLAAIGVMTDSLITVVGAMVVGPEFGPLAALAVGTVDRRWALIRRAVVALLVGFPAAMAVTAGATALAVAAGVVNINALDSLDRATDFIFHPGPFSLIVALLAGAVGMLSLTSGKSAALVGVFISVTTVPAAGYVAVALVSGEPHRAWGSLVQLVVNLAGIAVAAAVVLVIRRVAVRRLPHWRRPPRSGSRHRRQPSSVLMRSGNRTPPGGPARRAATDRHGRRPGTGGPVEGSGQGIEPPVTGQHEGLQQ